MQAIISTYLPNSFDLLTIELEYLSLLDSKLSNSHIWVYMCMFQVRFLCFLLRKNLQSQALTIFKTEIFKFNV